MPAIEAKIEESSLQNVRLQKQVDVLLMYWTNGPTLGGDHVAFYPDVYSRDGAVIKALNEPPVWRVR